MRVRLILLLLVIAGVLFQFGHFIEHAVQFGVYVFGPKTSPYMSPIAMYLSHQLGGFFFPAADMGRQMLMGMEILHLIGNTIFLLTIAGIYFFVKSKYVRWGFYVELFHLFEHIMLTLSALFLGKAFGISTLFGLVATFGTEVAVGYRVSWHFMMNLIPSLLLMICFTKRANSSSHDFVSRATLQELR